MIHLIMTILFLTSHSSPAWDGNATTYENLAYHLAYLTADSLGGRVATSKGDSLARAYIAGYFMKCGLRPISEDGTYLQPVPVLSSIAIDSSSTVALSHQNRVTALKIDSEFEVDSQSGCGQAKGEMVFLGFGIYMPARGYNDYGNLSLDHKIVMCYLYPPRGSDPHVRSMAFEESYIEKIERIRSMGGSAVVLICPGGVGTVHSKEILPPQHLRQQGIPVVRISENLAFRIMENAGMNVDTLKTWSAAKIPPRPFYIPDTRISMEIRLTYSYKDTYNVMGFLKGEDSTQTLVIGAHYDTEGAGSGIISAGADDNASGVSTVLEIARLCGRKDEYVCNLLFIAFGAEELRNIGSRRFMANLPQCAGRIKAMLNFDMVGRLTNDILYICQAQSAKEWESELREISLRDLDIRFGPNRSATDSGTFHEAGIPVLWFYTGPHRDNRARDELDSINISGMERIVQYSLDLVERISTDAVSLTFQDSIPRDKMQPFDF